MSAFVYCPECETPVNMGGGPILPTHNHKCDDCGTEFRFKSTAGTLGEMIDTDDDDNLYFKNGDYTILSNPNKGD